MKWSLPNQIMCFLLPVHSKPTADKMSVNKLKATFEIEQCWICEVLWWTFWKWRPVEILCQESIRDNIIYLHMKCCWIGQCWICAVFWWSFWKWRLVEIFQCRESIRDIIIYPHIKFWWYWTMLNFCSIVATILKMATARNFSMSGINLGHHYLPTYQILMISDNVEFLPPIFMPCFGSHFEHFNNAELLF